VYIMYVCVYMCACGNFDKPESEIEWNSIAIKLHKLTAVRDADLIIHIRLQVPHSCSEPYAWIDHYTNMQQDT
jgi:hypothetical protein